MKLPHISFVLVFGILCIFSCKNDTNVIIPKKQNQNIPKDSTISFPEEKKGGTPPSESKKEQPKSKKRKTKDTLKPRITIP